MSEPKVGWLFASDFDPSKIQSQRERTVRVINPFAMQCNACDAYIPEKRMFVAKREITNEQYESMPIYRFHIQCESCSSEIIYKTEPQNMDYIIELGAKRAQQRQRQDVAISNSHGKSKGRRWKTWISKVRRKKT